MSLRRRKRLAEWCVAAACALAPSGLVGGCHDWDGLVDDNAKQDDGAGASGDLGGDRAGVTGTDSSGVMSDRTSMGVDGGAMNGGMDVGTTGGVAGATGGMSVMDTMTVGMGGGDDAGVDDGDPACSEVTVYLDADGDGFGDPQAALTSCEPGAGYVADATDCDDTCADCHPDGTEACDVALLDEDCDGASNEGCACTPGESIDCGAQTDAGECSIGTQRCGDDGTWGDCVGAVAPTAERCDDLDNDCDGDVDDGVLNACGDCGQVPVEVCDGVDNDCDGTVDDGVLNACGECGQVPAELCDGVDNDCDGKIDNGVTNACGECGPVPAEVCDGVDNDCDGTKDEGADATCSWKQCGSGSCGVVAEVASGYKHTCARLDTGAVYCWGDNFQGQLGNGDGSGNSESVPQRVVGVGGSGFLTGALGISAGSTHTCARLSGSVVCWGANDVGQLGNSGAGASSAAPVTVAAGSNVSLSGVKEVDTGDDFTCARLANDQAACWGSNAQGALGNGDSGSGKFSSQAVRVLGEGSSSALGSVVQISAGAFHACARLSSANAVCWGYTYWGQVGNGGAINTNTPVTRPVRVVNTGNTGSLASVAAVSAGGASSCALLTSQHVVCWGDNSSGQLGRDSAVTGSASSIPFEVQGEGNNATLTNVAQISAGHGGHVCARLSSGQAACWGGNYSGQLGNGASGSGASTSQPVGVLAVGSTSSRMTGVAQVVAGTNHSCTLLNSGTVACFGMNDVGQLGIGSSGTSVPRAAAVVTP